MWFGMTLKQETPVQKPLLKAFPWYAQSSFILAVLYCWQGPLLGTVSLNVLAEHIFPSSAGNQR